MSTTSPRLCLLSLVFPLCLLFAPLPLRADPAPRIFSLGGCSSLSYLQQVDCHYDQTVRMTLSCCPTPPLANLTAALYSPSSARYYELNVTSLRFSTEFVLPHSIDPADLNVPLTLRVFNNGNSSLENAQITIMGELAFDSIHGCGEEVGSGTAGCTYGSNVTVVGRGFNNLTYAYLTAGHYVNTGAEYGWSQSTTFINSTHLTVTLSTWSDEYYERWLNCSVRQSTVISVGLANVVYFAPAPILTAVRGCVDYNNNTMYCQPYTDVYFIGERLTAGLSFWGNPYLQCVNVTLINSTAVRCTLIPIPRTYYYQWIVVRAALGGYSYQLHGTPSIYMIAPLDTPAISGCGSVYNVGNTTTNCYVGQQITMWGERFNSPMTELTLHGTARNYTCGDVEVRDGTFVRCSVPPLDAVDYGRALQVSSEPAMAGLPLYVSSLANLTITAISGAKCRNNTGGHAAGCLSGEYITITGYGFVQSETRCFVNNSDATWVVRADYITCRLTYGWVTDVWMSVYLVSGSGWISNVVEQGVSFRSPPRISRVGGCVDTGTFATLYCHANQTITLHGSSFTYPLDLRLYATRSWYSIYSRDQSIVNSTFMTFRLPVLQQQDENVLLNFSITDTYFGTSLDNAISGANALSLRGVQGCAALNDVGGASGCGWSQKRDCGWDGLHSGCARLPSLHTRSVLSPYLQAAGVSAARIPRRRLGLVAAVCSIGH